MSDTAFILLAAGNAELWDNYLNVPKQLAPFGGEPLIVRTMRQVRDRLGIEPIVMTRNERIEDAVRVRNTCWPEDCRWITATALSSKQFWKPRTFIIEADIYWDKSAMDHLCGLSGLRCIWAHSEQCAGYHWDNDEDRQRVETAFRASVLAAETCEHPTSVRGQASMPYSFHVIQGRPHWNNPHTHTGNKHDLSSPLCELSQGVARDMDYPYDYDGFMNHHEVDDLP